MARRISSEHHQADLARGMTHFSALVGLTEQETEQGTTSTPDAPQGALASLNLQWCSNAILLWLHVCLETTTGAGLTLGKPQPEPLQTASAKVMNYLQLYF